MVPTGADLGNFGLVVTHFKYVYSGVLIARLKQDFVGHTDQLWRILDALVAVAKLTVGSTAPCIQLIIFRASQRMKATCSHLFHLLVLQTSDDSG